MAEIPTKVDPEVCLSWTNTHNKAVSTADLRKKKLSQLPAVSRCSSLPPSWSCGDSHLKNKVSISRLIQCSFSGIERNKQVFRRVFFSLPNNTHLNSNGQSNHIPSICTSLPLKQALPFVPHNDRGHLHQWSPFTCIQLITWTEWFEQKQV